MPPPGASGPAASVQLWSLETGQEGRTVYSRRWIGGIALWLICVTGSGWLLGRHDQDVPWIPALRFAGTDTIYALRRVAGEAGLPLAIDEVRPLGKAGDLAFRRVDLDLPGGPLVDQIRRIQQNVGGSTVFDFRMEPASGKPAVVYVRSNLPTDARTNLDIVQFPEGVFDGSFDDLIQAIRGQAPVFLRQQKVIGVPYSQPFHVDVSKGDSAIDVLLGFARASGLGWRLQRAGYVVETRSKHEGLPVLPTTVSLWKALREPRPLPGLRAGISQTRSIAEIAERSGIPICILDRTILGDPRGYLDYNSLKDPGLPLEESLEYIQTLPDKTKMFTWEQREDVLLVRSRLFSDYIIKGSLLRQKVRGGHVDGTLGDVTRFLNSHYVEPTGEILLGGEILDGDPIVHLEIAPDSSVEDVLLQYANAAGDCWNYVAVEQRQIEFKLEIKADLPEFAFVGAVVSRTSRWAADPDPSLY